MKNKYIIGLIRILLTILLAGCVAEIKLKPPFRNNENDWSTYGNNNYRKNNSKFQLILPLELAWKYSGNAGISPQSPIIIDSILFIGFLNGELHAINLKTGLKVGKINLESSVEGCPTVDNSILYIPVAHSETGLRAYDVLEGRWKWKKKIPGIETSLLLIDENIYAATISGNLICINKTTGNSVWEYVAPKSIHSSPASDSNKIFFGCDDGYLYSLRKKDGVLLWSYYTGGSIFSTPLIHGDNVFFGSDDNRFYCIDAKTGLSKWAFTARAMIKSGSAISDSLVYFTSVDGSIYAINIKDGHQLWEFKAKSVTNTAPTISGKYVLFSSYDKFVYVLDKTSGEKKWEFESEGRMKTSPIFMNGFLIVCYEDYYVMAFRVKGEEK